MSSPRRSPRRTRRPSASPDPPTEPQSSPIPLPGKPSLDVGSTSSSDDRKPPRESLVPPIQPSADPPSASTAAASGHRPPEIEGPLFRALFRLLNPDRWWTDAGADTVRGELETRLLRLLYLGAELDVGLVYGAADDGEDVTVYYGGQKNGRKRSIDDFRLLRVQFALK